MPNYRKIYDDVFSKDDRYNRAENSPGLRAVIKATEQLCSFSGRSLDVGCGVGFVVEYLSGPDFAFQAYGADISSVSIDGALNRLAKIPGIKQRLKLLESQGLPFPSGHFALVTCFDVLEHLEVDDIVITINEMHRVLRPGGLFMGSVSCRKSGMNDLNGENLHRTVQSIDWWLERIDPDRVEYDAHRAQLTFWKRMSTPKQPGKNKTASETGVAPTSTEPAAVDDTNSRNSAQLYQKIYDENEWYGNADQQRCPGVRLLPKYQDWLIGPVMDLGCGRGQTVECLRELGFEADGIDQIQKNPEMRVGDITQPIPDIDKYRSTVCVDCIEHLYEAQVLGLFSNMKKVERHAFSIHNGESTETGQELHVNRQSFKEWGALIREHFEIAAAIKIHEQQMLYLTMTKNRK